MGFALSWSFKGAKRHRWWALANGESVGGLDKYANDMQIASALGGAGQQSPPGGPFTSKGSQQKSQSWGNQAAFWGECTLSEPSRVLLSMSQGLFT